MYNLSVSVNCIIGKLEYYWYFKEHSSLDNIIASTIDFTKLPIAVCTSLRVLRDSFLSKWVEPLIKWLCA